MYLVDHLGSLASTIHSVHVIYAFPCNHPRPSFHLAVVAALPHQFFLSLFFLCSARLVVIHDQHLSIPSWLERPKNWIQSCLPATHNRAMISRTMPKIWISKLLCVPVFWLHFVAVFYIQNAASFALNCSFSELVFDQRSSSFSNLGPVEAFFFPATRFLPLLIDQTKLQQDSLAIVSHRWLFFLSWLWEKESSLVPPDLIRSADFS